MGNDAAGVLTERGHIRVNENLQSIVHPHIFAIGTGDRCPMNGALSQQLQEQAATVAKNVKLLHAGQPLCSHKPSQGKDAQPITIKVGHGMSGYMWWNVSALPGLVQYCLCLPCRGGFPCCPLPCCWCCCPGCKHMFGTCGGEPEGQGPAVFVLETGNAKVFPALHGFTGLGEKPVQHATMPALLGERPVQQHMKE